MLCDCSPPRPQRVAVASSELRDEDVRLSRVGKGRGADGECTTREAPGDQDVVGDVHRNSKTNSGDAWPPKTVHRHQDWKAFTLEEADNYLDLSEATQKELLMICIHPIPQS